MMLFRATDEKVLLPLERLPDAPARTFAHLLRWASAIRFLAAGDMLLRTRRDDLSPAELLVP
jgi:hypothetical protein